MDAAVSPFPDDVEALKALLSVALKKAGEAEQRAATVEAKLANAQARASATEPARQDSRSHRLTMTGVPTATRSYKSTISSLNMRMHP